MRFINLDGMMVNTNMISCVRTYREDKLRENGEWNHGIQVMTSEKFNGSSSFNVDLYNDAKYDKDILQSLVQQISSGTLNNGPIDIKEVAETYVRMVELEDRMLKQSMNVQPRQARVDVGVSRDKQQSDVKRLMSGISEDASVLKNDEYSF